MKQYIQSLFPEAFFKNPAHFRALALGVLYLGTLLAQLFTFEKFDQVVAGFGLRGGSVTVGIVSWLLPLLGAASLPLLISMRMGEGLRLVSRTAVVALPLAWLVISIWLNLNMLSSGTSLNSGIFGETLEVPVGLWMVILCALWLWAAVLVVRELPPRR